ncbi:sugar ABC transporter substrate-binding protein [Streptomyces sp. NPDC051940]|uniref:ABC transporter substrate-binding protein n=1 Tax=Streptomyces sp. NPDC051940 TaxID=3155675 RepID=UPI0034454888
MRRISAATALAVAAAVALSGCGVGDGSSDKDAQQQVDKSAPLKGTISFQTWALKGDKFSPYFEKLIADFEKAHPGTTIKWVDQPGEGYDAKLTSQAASDNLPDVVNLPPDLAYPLAKTGKLLDLRKNVPTLEQDWVPSAVAAYAYQDLDGGSAAYGFPWYQGTDVNYWNKDLLTKNGLDPAKPPATVDELFAQAKTLHDKSGGKAYLISRTPGLMDLTNAGVQVIAPDAAQFTFNTPEAAALVQKYADAYKAGEMPRNIFAKTWQGNAALFQKKEVAWTTAGGRYIDQMKTDAPNLVESIVPSPAFKVPPLYSQGLSVAAKSKNLPLALEFAKFVANDANQRAFIELAPGFLPGTAASADDPAYSKSDGTPQGDASQYAFEALKEAKIGTPPQWNGEMNDVLNQELAKAITGKKSAKQALDDAVKQVNSLLQQ